MTKILSFLFLIMSISGFSQHTSDNKFIYIDDTTEIIGFLNGTWKFRVQGKTHKMKFDFDNKTLACKDDNNKHWYTGTKTRYKLQMQKGRIFLCAYEFDTESKKYSEFPYLFEIWLIDPKLFAINIDGDYGVYLVEKVRN